MSVALRLSEKAPRREAGTIAQKLSTIPAQNAIGLAVRHARPLAVIPSVEGAIKMLKSRMKAITEENHVRGLESQ